MDLLIDTSISSRFLRAVQGILLVAGAVAFSIFIFVVLLLSTRINPGTRQIEMLSDFASFSGAGLFFIVILFTFTSFLNISIRSKDEQEEERLRGEVREIDLELQAIAFHIDEVGADDEERQELTKKYNELKKERDLLIGKISQGWGQNISTDWGKTLIVARNRLLDEEQRLRARNFANLRYGVLAAVLGVFVLITAAIIPYIWTSFQTPAFNGIPVYYFPVTPVVIISEIVAIFFLRLHSQTEHRLERNKNEITNIELRLAAGLMLPSPTGQPDFTSLSNHLAKEERNFVLGKNESSAGVSTNSLLEILSKLILKGGS